MWQDKLIHSGIFQKQQTPNFVKNIKIILVYKKL